MDALPKSWPFEEAAKVAARLDTTGKDVPVFETGYGPSGLPHIGTFGEVARTSWVRRAYTELTGRPTRLIAFSDDMDGLRKVPDNVPNAAMLQGYLGQPLTRIPDPFGTHESFGAHNNARLRTFLDGFGFDYEFASATDYYASGRFDAALLRVLALHDEIRAVILPTLGAERRATYSPILPIHPVTGHVMQVPIEARDVDAGTVSWTAPDGQPFTTPVTGGACKLQWKADWAMRWFALGVDYEMSGKDLIDSVRLSGQVCRVLGVRASGRDSPTNCSWTRIRRRSVRARGTACPWRSGCATLRQKGCRNSCSTSRNAPSGLFFDVIPVRWTTTSPMRPRAATTRPPGLAHRRRTGAERGWQPYPVHHAAEPGQRRECRLARHAVGLHPPLPARRQPGHHAFPGPVGGLRGRLLP